MAIVHGVHRIIVKIDMCTESGLLEIKVPLISSGTVCFPPPMEGRYLFRIYGHGSHETSEIY